MRFFALLFCVFCALLPLTNHAQQTAVTDSLEKLLSKSNGNDRIKVLNDLCWEYQTIDPDKAVEYGYQALELAKAVNDSAGIAQSYNDLGTVFNNTGRYEKALDYYQRGFAIRQVLRDTLGLASLHVKIGSVYERRSEYSRALEEWIAALKIFEAYGQDAYVSYQLNNIAVINQHQRNYPAALDYYQQSVALKKALGEWDEIAGTYVNMASVYRLMGNDSLCRYYNTQAIELARERQVVPYLSQALNNMADMLLESGQYKAAIPHIEESLQLRLQLNDLKGEASSRVNLGHAYAGLGDKVEAERQLLAALDLAREIGARLELHKAHLQLSNLYETMPGKAALALEHLKHYANHRDTILNAETARQISELQTRYETERTERELNALELKKAEDDLAAAKTANTLERTRWAVVALVLLVILLLSFHAMFRRQQALKAQQQEAENRMAQQQTQLRAILKGEERERKRLALELHDGLGQLLSTIKLNVSGCQHEVATRGASASGDLNNALGLIDEAVSELRNISHNLMPSALLQLGLVPALEELTAKINRANQLNVRFQTFGMEQRSDAALEIMLYRVVQETLNNVLKYAQAKNVSVQLLREGNELNVMVEDDGVGFDTSTLKTATGIGWRNIQSRVEMMGGHIEVDSHPGHGTTVIIDLPANGTVQATPIPTV